MQPGRPTVHLAHSLEPVLANKSKPKLRTLIQK